MTAEPSLVWHYTTGHLRQAIELTGALMPTNDHAPKGEPPAVWFSPDERWEPTAAKGWIGPDGTRRRLTQRETCERGGGLVRFGVDPDRVPLVSWAGFRAVCLEHRVPRGYLNALERVSRDQGANPREHFAALALVRREDWARVDVLDTAAGWDARLWVPRGGYLHQPATHEGAA